MSHDLSAESSILVACLGSVAWVKMSTTADHHSAPCVKEFLYNRLDNGTKQFVVDLNECRGIDSTFIGMLFTLASKVKPQKGGVQVINPGERNATSIRKLGMDQYIDVDLEGTEWLEERELVATNLGNPLECKASTKRERAELILEAHEALIAANEENRSRFYDVVEFMKKDLEESSDEV